MEWEIGGITPGEMVDVKIRHCNKKLGLKDEIVSGYVGDDGFYLSDGGELSFRITFSPKQISGTYYNNLILLRL